MTESQVSVNSDSPSAAASNPLDTPLVKATMTSGQTVYVHPHWRGLAFTETGRDQYQKVVEFYATNAGKSGAELSRTGKSGIELSRDELIERLDYLSNFGRDSEGASRFYVLLSKDWADLSFSLTWYQRPAVTGQYLYLVSDWQYGWNGGLIWHESPNEPFTVSLTAQRWGIHT